MLHYLFFFSAAKVEGADNSNTSFFLQLRYRQKTEGTKKLHI
ncbi:hypothetical protein PARMER_00888 [Parabacteroides merdae ATCC 43184]|nr:hypothetical protein PARMER_00888 [Parabacteroides merdae ATCC 43184]